MTTHDAPLSSYEELANPNREPDTLSLMLDLYFDTHNIQNPDAEILSPHSVMPDTVVAPWDDGFDAPRVRPILLGEAKDLFPTYRPADNPQAMAFIVEIQQRFDVGPEMYSLLVEPGHEDIVLEGPEFTSETTLDQQGMPAGPDKDTVVELLRDTLKLLAPQDLLASPYAHQDGSVNSDNVGQTMYRGRDLLQLVQ